VGHQHNWTAAIENFVLKKSNESISFDVILDSITWYDRNRASQSVLFELSALERHYPKVACFPARDGSSAFTNHQRDLQQIFLARMTAALRSPPPHLPVALSDASRCPTEKARRILISAAPLAW
jgi:hypothetical protein